MKFKAGTLFTVLVISLIIAILTSLLIYYAYLSRVIVFENQLKDRLELNVNSAINILLSEKDFLGEKDSLTLDLYDQQTDSVVLKRMQWGVLDVGIAKAFSGIHQVERVFQYGYVYDEKKRFALYLTDQDRPLSVAGSTLIKGDAYLPESGIRSTYINGQAFKGKRLVEGQIKKSDKKLYPINDHLIEAILPYLNADSLYLSKYGSVTKINTDSIKRLFTQPTVLVRLKKKEVIKASEIMGNVIIVSNEPLIISSDTKIRDALIFAPAIEIQDGFEGSLQAFASDSLIVGKNCKLNYPSVLGLIKREFNNNQPFIRVKKGSLVNGIVFSTLQNSDLIQTKVDLQKGAKVEGIIYVNGFLNMEGNVWGTVYCNTFTLRTSSTYYENHLFNIQIDQTRLSKYFVSSSLIGGGVQKRIIQWF